MKRIDSSEGVPDLRKDQGVPTGCTPSSCANCARVHKPEHPLWRKCAECGLGMLCKSCYSPSAHECRKCNNLRRLTSDEQRYFHELSGVAWEEVIDAAGQNISVLTVDFSGTPSLSNDNLGCLTQTLFITFMELFWSDKEM